ncbi:MAG: phytanoyl-CoA dioxygenase family protein [Sporocytophaga sp.]|nr:phytanoyl-CoA dioxygenase family protein [Sporocytophaga sp.]
MFILKKKSTKLKLLFRSILAKHFQKKKRQVYAIRQALIEIPELTPFLFNKNLKKILASKGDNLFLTKAIYFDKPPESNWYVTWHQDITINVNKKTETEGYTGWTQKANVISVCPPEEILKNTLTIRIHLDDTDERNGGLKIIPGSHQKKLNDDQIATITQNSMALPCEVKAGGIHFMKPLLLHASSKVTNQKHRRVLHLEFNSLELPGDMEWGEKVKS